MTEKLDSEVTSYLEEMSGITVIETVMDLDLYSAIKLKELFNEMCDAGTKQFIIDMKFTRYVDSSGLGILIHMHTRTQKKEGMDIRFINVCDNVMKVITLTHLEKMLGIVADLETAIQEMKGLPGTKTSEEPNDGDHSEPVPAPASAPLLDQEMQLEVEEFLPEESAGSVPPPVLKLRSDESNDLFDRKGLKYKQFHLTISGIRKAVKFLVNNLPLQKKELKSLEREIYALLKNAVKHGNRNRWWLPVKVWYKITPESAHLIIEDKGKGFTMMEEWNEFYRKRILAHYKNDKEEIKRYKSFDSPFSDNSDRGTALCSTLEYWNEGVIFNNKRNAIAVKIVF